MPLRIQRDVKEIEGILNDILNIHSPPVGRCRLLSSGFSPTHALNITEDISGHKECLGCGNCIDACPFLFREPSRREKTEQRTSMALESIIGEDCDQCGACILTCPQVDTTIKNYVVNHRIVEVMSRLEQRIGNGDEPDLDLFLEETINQA
ncbi:4Fe-4S dicluster domain-containing protein [Chloroflexota bacterium]